MSEAGISIPPNVSFLQSFDEAHAVDQLRMYDDAIYKWVASCRLPQDMTDTLNRDGIMIDPIKPISIVFATPRRGYGEIANLVNRNHPEQVRERDKIVRPIDPACSITRRGIQKDFTRWSMAHFRHAGFVTPEKKDIYQIPYPVPVNIAYQLDFTAINRSVLNTIETWLLLQFDDDKFFVTVDPGIVLESVYITPYAIPVVANMIEDNSDLESTDGDRILRLTLDLTVQGWLFRPARRMKTVLDVKLDIEIGQSQG